MPAKLPKNLARAALALVELFDDGAAKAGRVPPTEFCIFKRGVNSSVKGDYLFDDKAAAMVMDAYQAHGVDLMIDYDHHALATNSGVKAIAAGWFNLAVREGDLYATNVRWTEEATAHLQAGEYRYFSPLFDYDRKTGRVEKLINNALTNTPALFDIDALVAASALFQTKEDNVDPELQKALAKVAELERQNAAHTDRIKSLESQTATAALSTTIGLAASAGPDEIRTRVAALSTFRKDVMALTGKDTEAAALGALTALKEKADAEPELRIKVEKAETAALSATWGAHLDGLSTKGEDGKFLPPAKRKKAEEMALSLGGGKLTADGIEKAKGYVSEMLVSGVQGAGEGDKQTKGTVALSGVQGDVLKRMGIKPDAFRTSEEKRLAGG